MAADASPSAYVVRDAATARVFADSAKRRLLLAFVERPRAVAEVARQSGEPLARVHYHVVDLARRGLLEVVSEEKRRGRPIKYYRTVRASFFVPAEFVDRSPGAGLAAELRARIDEEVLACDAEGLLFCTEKGRPRIVRVPGEARRRPFGEYWYVFSMTDADAAALSNELDALFRSYRERQSDKGRPFLIHAAFAPRRR